MSFLASSWGICYRKQESFALILYSLKVSNCLTTYAYKIRYSKRDMTAVFSLKGETAEMGMTINVDKTKYMLSTSRDVMSMRMSDDVWSPYYVDSTVTNRTLVVWRWNDYWVAKTSYVQWNWCSTFRLCSPCFFITWTPIGIHIWNTIHPSYMHCKDQTKKINKLFC